jgi:iron complex transport system ATP-binding protein
MVRIDELAVDRGGRRLLGPLSATLAPGVTGLIGPNGAGKSTLIRAAAGLVPHAGEVTVQDRSVAAMTPRERSRSIAYLPQGQAVHWPLTVERLVALGRLPHLAPMRRPGAADAKAIEEALCRTQLLGLRARSIDTLSGGERARTLLARALAVGAPVLLADEPLAALDPLHQIEVMQLLRAEADRGVTVLAVLHDLTVAARWCDRLMLLDRGRLAAFDNPRAVLTRERIASVYGVHALIADIDGAAVVTPIAPS